MACRTRPLLPMLTIAAAACAGCSSSRVSPPLAADADVGRYARPRAALQARLSDDTSDRSYILDRLRLLILTLADGSPDAAEEVANQTFRLLRTQGLNADRTTSSVVFNEGVKIWKGEPFEQALAYTYIAAQKAQRGEWDNARAAASSSIFLLKDFGVNERGEPVTGVDIARRAAKEDQRSGGSGDEYIDHGYTPIKTDFALGYLLSGLANRAIGRDEEASDNFNEAVSIDGELASLAAALASDECNTVLIVESGRGPVKAAYGPDNAFVRFMPRVRHSEQATIVSVDGGSPLLSESPPVLDVNRMAASHFWNNLEDVRYGKSVVGSALVYTGIIVAASADQEDDSDRHTQQAIGAGIAVLGALLKATASADTRHCEFLPQRVDLIPLRVDEPDAFVTLTLPDGTVARVPGLDPPPRDLPVQLRLLRIPGAGSPEWVRAGSVVYANDRYEQRVEGDHLPYILGGTCVRSPSPEALEYYQRHGQLQGWTTNDLENLYREEGISLTVEDQGGASRVHILEGGDSLVCPLEGTAGWLRLFGQKHPPYCPRSDALRAAIERIQSETKSPDEAGSPAP